MTNDNGTMRSGAWLVVMAGVAVVALLTAVQAWRLRSARNHVVQMALAADSVEASRDTTRGIYMSAALSAAARAALAAGAGGTADSVRVVQRRVVQAMQRADALDKALRLERVVRQRLEVVINGFREREGKAVVDGGDADSVRRAVFDVRHAPYTVHAEVALPAAPEVGRMDVRVDLDTIRLEARVGCGVALNGVRAASLSVVAPSWANVGVSRVEQAPGVCGDGGDGTVAGAIGAWRRIRERFGVLVGYGAVRGSNGTVTAGVGVSAGFKVWP